jgi:Zn-dependent protease with chaperone function
MFTLQLKFDRRGLLLCLTCLLLLTSFTGRVVATTIPTASLAGHEVDTSQQGDDKKAREAAKRVEKERLEREKNEQKRERDEQKIRNEYNRLRNAAKAKLRLDSSFKMRVDISYNEVRRQHSEYGFKINTFDANDERVTYTGDKLKTEDTLYDNPLVQDYVNRVGQSLVPSQSRIRYAFKVILNPVPDARAYSTGTVYITSGLLSMIDNEAQLAYILGHEIGHNEKQHWYDDALVAAQLEDENRKREQTNNMVGGLAGLFTGGLVGLTGGGVTGGLLSATLAINQATTLLKFLNPQKVFIWDQLQEDEADHVGFDLMFSRNYDPREVPKLLQRMRKFSEAEQRVTDGFLAQIERIDQRTGFVNSLMQGQIVKPNLFRGASNLRRKREKADTGLVSPLEAGKVFGIATDAAAREADATKQLTVNEELLKEKLAKGEIIGSGPEFDSVMADLKRDNGIRAFYYDMYYLAIENLKEALLLRSEDAYTHYFHGKVLALTAHTPEERALSMKSFVRAIELDQRRTISAPWLYRALSLMADQNPTQNPQIIGYLKTYVEIYQQEHGGVLPPNMDAIYAYLKDLGEERWVARPVVNISTHNIDPIRIVSAEEAKAAPREKTQAGACATCPSSPTPRPSSPKPRATTSKARRIN